VGKAGQAGPGSVRNGGVRKAGIVMARQAAMGLAWFDSERLGRHG